MGRRGGAARGGGRWRLFRYEVRCWPGGVIPDIADAVAGPQRVSVDADRARRLLELVPAFPPLTWGRDERHTGDMWNSNSLISWLLAVSGHHVGAVVPPGNGRAPGWRAGLVVAARPAGPRGYRTAAGSAGDQRRGG